MEVTGGAETVADDPGKAEREARIRQLRAAPVPKARKAVVTPKRPADVVKARVGLPIIAMEQEIMEAIAENPVVVLCGATGCGKTTQARSSLSLPRSCITQFLSKGKPQQGRENPADILRALPFPSHRRPHQVPQFMYEAGFGSGAGPYPGAVAVTQPRRVAVTSTARRVAYELGADLGAEVGYQIRYDRRLTGASALRFMTDGVLLREIQADLLLPQYSAVVIDEAHERSVNTDILLGLLSRVVPLRERLAKEPGSKVKPLKLIVMCVHHRR